MFDLHFQRQSLFNIFADQSLPTVKLKTSLASF